MSAPEVSADLAELWAALPDGEIVRRVCAGDRALFEVLMRRHNQRIYRAARAIVKDEAEAEDVMQQAYVNAFTHLAQFEQRSRFSTWLTQIAVNEALARRQKLRAAQSLTATLDDEEGPLLESIQSRQPDPERQAYAGELQRVLEAAVDTLPETYRTVFMLRDVEGMSTAETAEGLGVGDEAVKTRLHPRAGDGPPRDCRPDRRNRARRFSVPCNAMRSRRGRRVRTAGRQSGAPGSGLGTVRRP